MSESEAAREERYEQLSLFAEETQEEKTDEEKLERERKLQQAMIDVKNRYGKNAMVKGMNLQEGATTMERNRQIGGHKA